MFASKGEKRRMCERGSVEINGVRVRAQDEVTFPALVVLHPKSKHRTTMGEFTGG